MVLGFTLGIIYLVLLLVFAVLSFRKGHWVLGLIGQGSAASTPVPSSSGSAPGPPAVRPPRPRWLRSPPHSACAAMASPW